MNDRIWYSAGSPPAVVRSGYHVITNSDARLEVFAIGDDGNLWWAFQNAQIDGGFAGNLSSWFSLGKPPRFFIPSSIVVGVNGDGRVEVFGGWEAPDERTLTGLFHIAQELPGATTVIDWGGWKKLPPPPTGGPLGAGQDTTVDTAPSLFVARDSDLTLEVFAFGEWNACHVMQSAPGVWSSLPQWLGLGTRPPALYPFFGVVGRNLDGRLEAIAVGRDMVQLPSGDGADSLASVIWRCSQLSANDSGWTDWSIINYASPLVPPTSAPLVYPMSVAANRDGRLDVFFGADGGGVFHMEQLNPAGMSWLSPEWSDVQDLGIPTPNQDLDTATAFPAVALNPYTGLLEAFVVGNDHALWHATQATPDRFSGWGAWESFGKPGGEIEFAKGGFLSLAVDAADRIWVFAEGQTGDCYFTPNRFTMPTPKNISIEVTPHWNCGVAENYSITVLDSGNRTPISGALVSLTSGDGTGQPKSKERHGTTNATGSIEFQNVVLKDWKVKIPQKRGVPDWVENQPQLQVSARGYPTFTTAVDCPPLTPDG